MAAPYLADLLDLLVAEALYGVDPARTGHAAPTRTFTAHGPPALDVCTDNGLLVAYLARAPHLHPRSPGRAPTGCMVTVTAECVIELWRCHPTMRDDGSPHPAAVYDEAARDLLVDLWALLAHLYVAWQDGDLLPPGQACNAVEFGTATPLGPQGGVAGWRVPLTYQLTDPDPSGIAS